MCVCVGVESHHSSHQSARSDGEQFVGAAAGSRSRERRCLRLFSSKAVKYMARSVPWGCLAQAVAERGASATSLMPPCVWPRTRRELPTARPAPVKPGRTVLRHSRAEHLASSPAALHNRLIRRCECAVRLRPVLGPKRLGQLWLMRCSPFVRKPRVKGRQGYHEGLGRAVWLVAGTREVLLCSGSSGRPHAE